jgi:mannose-1-phosphate guanylyltransferase
MREALAHGYGVILAGGSGTRLWPLSTKALPKQFLAIGGHPSLIGQSAARLKLLVPGSHLTVVCGSGHAAQLSDYLPEFGPEQIIIEPQARNTAPALALAAIHLRHRDPEALMIVLPADHLILPQEWEKFAEDIRLAARAAQQERALVTLGISPTHPSTGFGYLQRGDGRGENGSEYFTVRAFHEKPDFATAESYLRKGDFYWNSGMFVWEAATFLEQLKKHQPEMSAAFEKLAGKIDDPNYKKFLQETFEKAENISVDYAVMEPSDRVMMVPARFDWDDVGNFLAFTKLLSCDEQQNFTSGEVFPLEASGNMVVASTKPVALIGVKDLLVVESERSVLIMPKERAQEVKEMVQYLKQLGREDLL